MTWAIARKFGPWVLLAIALAIAWSNWQSWSLAAKDRDVARAATKVEAKRADEAEALVAKREKEAADNRQLVEAVGRRLDRIEARPAQTRTIIETIRRTGDAPTRAWIDTPVPDAVRRVLERPTDADPDRRDDTAGGAG